RHPVRLISVAAFDGAVPLSDPFTGAEVTEIAWRPEDALPFPLCISSVTDEALGAFTVAEVSVARGNIVFADHGRSVSDEAIGRVPTADLAWDGACGGDPCAATDADEIAPRFRP